LMDVVFITSLQWSPEPNPNPDAVRQTFLPADLEGVFSFFLKTRLFLKE
jgi:hypothetical protein